MMLRASPPWNSPARDHRLERRHVAAHEDLQRGDHPAPPRWRPRPCAAWSHARSRPRYRCGTSPGVRHAGPLRTRRGPRRKARSRYAHRRWRPPVGAPASIIMVEPMEISSAGWEQHAHLAVQLVAQVVQQACGASIAGRGNRGFHATRRPGARRRRARPSARSMEARRCRLAAPRTAAARPTRGARDGRHHARTRHALVRNSQLISCAHSSSDDPPLAAAQLGMTVECRLNAMASGSIAAPASRGRRSVVVGWSVLIGVPSRRVLFPAAYHTCDARG